MEAAFQEDLDLLTKALRGESFRFILIGHNRKSIYFDFKNWIEEQIPNRPIIEVPFSNKNYRQISDELQAIEKGILLIPDFDWLFREENKEVCIAFNQRRDFFAKKPLAFICFLQPSNFLAVPEKVPDWWSLRSLEVEFERQITNAGELSAFSRSQYYLQLGNLSKTEKELELDLLLEQQKQADPQNHKLNWNLHDQIGKLYGDLANYNAALTHWKEGLSIAKILNNKELQADNLGNIGLIYGTLGDNDQALSMLEESLAIQKEIGDNTGIGSSLNNIGSIFKIRGDYDQALSLLEESLAIQKEIGDKNGMGTTLNNISQIYYARGDYDQALSILEESLTIRKEISDKAGMGAILINISSIYQDRGDYDKALSLLEESLVIKKEIGDKAGMVVNWHNIAIIALQTKRVKQFFKMEGKAYKLATKIGYAQGIFSTSKELGITLYNQGKKREGLSYLFESYQFARKLNNPDVTEIEEILKKEGYL